MTVTTLVIRRPTARQNRRPDILMSLIHTCELEGVNPFQSMVAMCDEAPVRAPRHRDHLFHAIVITHSTASCRCERCSSN
jgi:hypothetical protein